MHVLRDPLGWVHGLLLLTLCLGPTAVRGQPLPEQGRPFIDTYTSQQYGGHPQSFDLVTGPQGRLYVANARGVLVYDGETWRLVEVAGQTAVRSLAVGPEGTVYVGGQGEIGRLVPNGAGGLRYASLLSHVPAENRDFNYVWNTHAVGEAVYFGTQRRLFRWRDGQMRSWDGPFLLSFAARSTVYAQRRGGPLLRVGSDSLRVLPGTGSLPTLYFMIPHRAEGMLLGTRSRGLLRYADGRVSSWRPEAAERLATAFPYAGVSLPGGGVAIGTRGRGVFVYGPDGTLRRHVTQSSGLIENLVYALHLDAQGGLWAAQSQGLSRIETHHSLSTYGTAEGLSGNVFETLRAGGTLYAGTLKGLFALGPPERAGQAARFEKLDVPGMAHDLLSYETGILAATEGGVFQVSGDETTRLGILPQREQAAVLAWGPRDSTRLYVGTRRGPSGPGLIIAEKTGAEWSQQRRIDVPALSRLTTGPEGALWGGTAAASLLRLVPQNTAGNGPPQMEIARFDTSDGLPSMRANLPYRVDDRLVVGTSDGPYRFESESERFVPYTTLRAPLPAPSQYVEPIAEDAAGRVWMRRGETETPVTGRLVPTEETDYTWRPGRLRRLVGFNTFDIYRDDGATWIGGPGFGPDALLVRHAPEIPTSEAKAYDGPPALLRRVQILEADSALALSRDEPPALAYAHNAVRFSYAAPAFDAPEKTTYRTRLDGYDRSWSAWRTASEATYTNLAPGRYVFRVQARDGYHERGAEAQMAFTVRPPWYRTWSAYALWGLLGLLGVFGAVRGRTWQLRRRQQQLEATVAERTDEVRRQRDQLERQAEQLKELDDAKSRFFANISHEFRTPLTLLLGPLEQIRDAAADRLTDEEREHIDRMTRNLHRLRRLINQVLDLAELDAGRLSLEARPLRLGKEVARIAGAFRPLAERQEIDLHIDADPAPESAPPLVADPESLEHIVGNLLSNALKFTPAGERVAVHVRHTDAAGMVEVTDTGPGIPPDEQDAVFNRFRQAQQSRGGEGDRTRAEEGTGIGLALVHELVELHGGAITLESGVGEGATFTVQLPRGRDHLSDEHLSERHFGDGNGREPSPGGPTDERPTAGGASVPAVIDKRGSSTADPGAASETESDVDDPDRPTVLVVDDNADMRQYVLSVLAPDFRVLTAGDGAEGVAAAQEALPDCILADVMMPKVDGVAMTERLRADERTAAIPIVMLTARAGADDEIEGLSAGATDYVTKPFDPQVLQMRVRGTLAYQERLRRRLLQELQAEPDGDDADASATGTADASADVPASEEPASEAPAPADPEPEPAPFEAEMRDVIARRLPDPDFDTNALADAMAVSRSTLYRRARNADAPSPAELIRTMRLERGAELLEEAAGTVSEVAYAVGFNSLAHFSRKFTNHFDRSPTDYVADADGR